ncbi:hypothetical protein GW17_00004113 [Ensete ventricosum]|nr:hypothetical protein GW17_00004113 [Ensete ventricosum]RZR98222.1 hypothetical protein BHM03_00027532 [Ensete ventricosum]
MVSEPRKRGKTVAGHGQDLCKGGWPRPGHPQGGGHPRPGHPQGGGRLRPGPARKGGRRRPQGEADASACRRPPAWAATDRGELAAPPTASPQRGGARGSATRGSRAGHRGGRPLAGRLPVGKAAAACSRAAAATATQ